MKYTAFIRELTNDEPIEVPAMLEGITIKILGPDKILLAGILRDCTGIIPCSRR